MAKFVISKNLDGTGHHLFLLRRLRAYLDADVPMELITPMSNKEVVRAQLDTNEDFSTIYLGRSASQLFLKALIKPDLLLGNKTETKVSLIHDDVNWRDLIFYIFFAVRLIISDRKQDIPRIKTVFRYTFTKKIKKFLYGKTLKLLSVLGYEVTSDSIDILRYWNLLDNSKQYVIPVNLAQLFPIILSVNPDHDLQTTVLGERDIRVGVPGILRIDKGLTDVLALNESDLEGIDLRVNLPNSVKSENLKITEFGKFDNDEHYSQALSKLDFQLFWFDAERYRHATSSTFFEALISGVVPLTRTGTFCATILERSKLSQLIFDDIADAMSFARMTSKAKIVNSIEFQDLRTATKVQFSDKIIQETLRRLIE